jgi:protein TonB
MLEAPPVAGVRRELMMPFGGKAPRLGGVRAVLDARTETAAPIFDSARSEPDPAKGDAAPPVGGVEGPAKEGSQRTNIAAIAAAISVLAHAAVLAWAIHSIRPDEALAKGDDSSPVVIEGVSVVLLDQMPTKESPELETLAEAKAVEDTETARVTETENAKVEEATVTPEQPTEIAALTETDIQQPVAEATASVPEPATAAVVDDTPAMLAESSPAEEDSASTAEAAEPAEDDTRVAVADDAPAASAAADQSAELSPATTDESAVPADAVPEPVETETALKVEEPPTEVLAKDLPANSAAATDLYLDSVDTGDDKTVHAALADETAQPVDPPEPDPAAVDDEAKVAPLEEKADPMDLPQDSPAPPKPKKVAAVKSAPSKERNASVAEQTATGPLSGIFGAGGTSEAERGRANTSSYRAQLAAHLRRYRSYPDAARDRSLAGTVRVAFTVNASGHVTGARLTRSSGYAVLDRAALGMVNRASPFPAIPANLAIRNLSVDVPVRFDAR